MPTLASRPTNPQAWSPRWSAKGSSGASPAPASTTTADAGVLRPWVGTSAHGAAALAAQVPDHVGFGNPLAAGDRLDLLPGQLRLGKLVPAGEIEGLDGAFQR